MAHINLRNLGAYVAPMYVEGHFVGSTALTVLGWCWGALIGRPDRTGILVRWEDGSPAIEVRRAKSKWSHRSLKWRRPDHESDPWKVLPRAAVAWEVERDICSIVPPRDVLGS